MKLYNVYVPITATPYRNTDDYTEILPCDELRPHIRCFWGSKGETIHYTGDERQTGIVTPDTCVDVIFNVSYTDNKIVSNFCGINDETFITSSKYSHAERNSTFAVRFYAWSAILFADESMKGTKNQFIDAGILFDGFKEKMEKHLFETKSLEERSKIAEEYLIKRLCPQRENSLFMRAVKKMITENGNLRVLELATDLHISSRQMERIFLENMGVTPKKAADLIRYQCLWQEICLKGNFNIFDAVYKYGYTDQAHLLNDFRKKHSMSMKAAVCYARNDEFLQERPAIIL